uniref:Uncharacterized protein n=1 Tax=Fagus sylvatica TaxID=28930 RepID=A0A2N9E5G8_FAGSY
MMGSDLGQDHHAQGGSGAFSRIRRVGGGVSVLCGRGWGAAEAEARGRGLRSGGGRGWGAAEVERPV